MIITRYERGQKFLDLDKHVQRSLDEDGCAIYDECWTCVIYENGADANEHNVVEFGNKDMAIMFISQNGWSEQVL